ncbi:unnamed protein product [Prorocentrum cordatum]|uniref:Thymidine kinase n=1 Tax=Prorocentrum cordatum TaxID=2364126 RepID=A0ABN9UTL5_9DINO|nr:unnamed protein product [Polarella glacialis]
MAGTAQAYPHDVRGSVPRGRRARSEKSHGQLSVACALWRHRSGATCVPSPARSAPVRVGRVPPRERCIVPVTASYVLLRPVALRPPRQTCRPQVARAPGRGRARALPPLWSSPSDRPRSGRGMGKAAAERASPAPARKAGPASPSSSAAPPRWILISGQPGCGKTYMIEREVQRLASLGVRCQGFYTAETLQTKGSARDGFDIVCHPSGVRRALARKATASGVDSSAWRARTGPYKVDVSAIDETVVPVLTAARPHPDIYVIDEIGRMEMHSKKFCKAVEALFGSGSLLFGSIAAPRYGHVVPYCERLKRRKGVCVLGLKKSTREEVRAAEEDSGGAGRETPRATPCFEAGRRAEEAQ